MYINVFRTDAVNQLCVFCLVKLLVTLGTLDIDNYDTCLEEVSMRSSMCVRVCVFVRMTCLPCDKSLFLSAQNAF